MLSAASCGFCLSPPDIDERHSRSHNCDPDLSLLTTGVCVLYARAIKWAFVWAKAMFTIAADERAAAWSCCGNGVIAEAG